MRTVGPETSWVRDLRTKVRMRLRDQGVPQAVLASHLGITQKHMSDVLNGKADGSPNLLASVAASVGLRIAVVDSDEGPLLPHWSLYGEAEPAAKGDADAA